MCVVSVLTAVSKSEGRRRDHLLPVQLPCPLPCLSCIVTAAAGQPSTSQAVLQSEGFSPHEGARHVLGSWAKNFAVLLTALHDRELHLCLRGCTPC